jgi:hypothetical protein
MTDATDMTTAVVPAEPVSSLQGGALADLKQCEAWLAEGPRGSYYTGVRDPDTGEVIHSGQEIQDTYAALLEGELQGSAGPVWPEHQDDGDVPKKPSNYDLTGLQIYDAPTRDIVDTFAREAHDSGFGQERFRSVVAWALQQTGPPTEAAFRRWAQSEGFSSTMIRRAIGIYNDMKKEHKV